MVSNKEKKHFYPQLVTRILLYLRQQRFSKEKVLTEDIIERFNKSKSRISQVLSFLANHGYIERQINQNFDNNCSRHKIFLSSEGLHVAESILSDGLDPLEKEVIKALKLRFNDAFHLTND